MASPNGMVNMLEHNATTYQAVMGAGEALVDDISLFDLLLSSCLLYLLPL